MTLAIRIADESHAAFLNASWRESYAQFAPERFAVRNRDELFELIRLRMRTVFAHQQGLFALVAVDPETPRWIGGWMVGHVLPHKGLCVHWAYVKHSHRRLGIFSALLHEANERASWPETLLYTQDPPAHQRGLAWPAWLKRNGFERVQLERVFTGEAA